MEKGNERVLIVGVELDNDTFEIDDSLDELEELVKAAGGEVIGRIIQRKDRINAALFVGKGKAEEIRDFCQQLEIDSVVFNDELSGAQLRNLEEIIDRKIIDRTTLILDIFALRAASKEGKLQVKLAQMKYRLPRLIGMRDYLSREGAGIGTRGPGEQKLETDRRHILREIKNIEKQLKEVEGIREVKRKKRLSSNIPMVALVGYTNAGKSTLTNSLMVHDSLDEDFKKVYVEDMLFATLDTSHRISKLPNGQDFLVSDTVGFVSKLPTKLIEAFKGTLEEVKYADLLLHVVDASNEDLDIQIKTTISILKELNVMDKPMITVFNKMDKINIQDLIYDHKLVEEPLFISCKTGKNLDVLLKQIQEKLPQEFRYVKLLIPFDKQNLTNYFMNNYDVNNLQYLETGTTMELTIDNVDYEKYKDYIIE